MNRLWLSLSLSALLCAGVATPAQADEVIAYQASKPNEAETRWINNFGGPTRPILSSERFRMRWRAGLTPGGLAGTLTPSEKEPVLEARGVRVRFEDLDVQRMRFKTPEEAMLYAGHLEETPKGTELIEVRGNQVAVMRGSGLSEPRFAVMARRLVWRELGPVSDTPDLLAVREGQSASVRSIRSGPYYEGLKTAMTTAREKREDMERPESSIQATWHGDQSVEVAGPTFTSHLREGDAGVHGTVSVGEGHAANSARLERYLETVESEMPGPPLNRPQPTQQQRGAVDQVRKAR